MDQDPVPKYNKSYPYDDKSGLRSENADFGSASAAMPGNPPVSVLEDMVGRFSQSKGQNNAFRDAIRQRLIERLTASGGRN